MPDPRSALQSMFNTTNRYANFGDILMRIHVQGIRCHVNTIIDIESPITAFCGPNGTGKSTLLQLAAAAYKNPNPGGRPYYIYDFLVVGTLDPHPFADDASVEFRYWQENRTTKPVTLSRSHAAQSWSGYRRRPARIVFFAGIGLYLPKIERRDFIVHKANQLVIANSSVMPGGIIQSTCSILGCHYDGISANTVSYSKQTGTVISVQRQGVSYSEAHMGYGEGRSQYLIRALETLADRSLVLIEEPETSLHPSAQHEFAKYLVDVVRRKRHQVLLTTHSEFVLEALPAQSLIYLDRGDVGVTKIIGLTSLQAKSLMANGHVKALSILVEDDCAKAILCEIIRRIDADFLRSVGIYPIGDANTVGTTVRSLRDTGLPVAAVRDADKGDAPHENIFKLPGTQPPEKELFACAAMKELMHSSYQLNLDDFIVRLANTDHHDWFEHLADYLNVGVPHLLGEVARAYAARLTENDASSLVILLKEASRQ